MTIYLVDDITSTGHHHLMPQHASSTFINIDTIVKVIIVRDHIEINHIGAK